MLRFAALFALCLPLPSALAQPQPEEFRVYTEHPRLLLRPQRLRLLKRERERQSMRWRQLEVLISGQAQMPEPGFALALYFAVTGDAKVGKRAVDWALGPGSDLRQLALVYDWCQDVLAEAESNALASKILKALAAAPLNAPVPVQRTRAFAAIAIAERSQDTAESILRGVVVQWWRGRMAPNLLAGSDLDAGADTQALLELLHAVRDNLTIDLRVAAPGYFKTLPAFSVICNYPAPYPTPENEFRIPVYNDPGEPDLARAALARAAGLSLVAYDTNALENQFLQGWLIQDRFMLRGVFGAPYEFLWANPYQPGLSYAHLPLIFHDERSGALFVRSDWDEDATWFALHQGQMQLYREGRITVLTQKGPLAAAAEAIRIGKAAVILARGRLKFKATGGAMFIVGGKPKARYDIEVDDEEMTELLSDLAGTVALDFPKEEGFGVRVQESVR